MRRGIVTWKIPSTDGWQSAELTPVRVFENRGENLVQISISLSGQAWDPFKVMTAREYTLELNCTCTFSNVIIKVSGVDALVIALSDWYLSESACELKLSPDPEPEVWFAIVQREGSV